MSDVREMNKMLDRWERYYGEGRGWGGRGGGGH